MIFRARIIKIELTSGQGGQEALVITLKGDAGTATATVPRDQIDRDCQPGDEVTLDVKRVRSR